MGLLCVSAASSLSFHHPPSPLFFLRSVSTCLCLGASRHGCKTRKVTLTADDQLLANKLVSAACSCESSRPRPRLHPSVRLSVQDPISLTTPMPPPPSLPTSLCHATALLPKCHRVASDLVATVSGSSPRLRALPLLQHLT